MLVKRRLVVILISFTYLGISQPLDSLINSKPENYFRLNYENDFFCATDRYYTQGIFLDFIIPAIKRSPISYCLIKLNKQTKNYYGLHLEQDVFTPRSIRYKGGQVYYGERPFTAIFFVSHSLSSLMSHKKMLLRTQLDMGIMGPYAMGEEEQKAIHKTLKNIEPLGWQNQLSNDFILNYSAKFEKGIVNKKYFELIGNTVVRLGTLYTNTGIGITVRVGFFSPYFNNLGMERISLSCKRCFKCYLITKANVKYAGYNATLQGGLTNSGNIYELSDSNINRYVADLYGGIVLTYKRIGIEYGKSYITPEFKGGVDHGWGKCVITVCF